SRRPTAEPLLQPKQQPRGVFGERERARSARIEQETLAGFDALIDLLARGLLQAAVFEQRLHGPCRRLQIAQLLGRAAARVEKALRANGIIERGAAANTTAFAA